MRCSARKIIKIIFGNTKIKMICMCQVVVFVHANCTAVVVYAARFVLCCLLRPVERHCFTFKPECRLEHNVITKELNIETDVVASVNHNHATAVTST